MGTGYESVPVPTGYETAPAGYDAGAGASYAVDPAGLDAGAGYAVAPQGYDAGVSSGYAVKNDEWTPVNGAAGSVESANYNPEESSYNNYDLKGLQSEDRADVDESGEVEEEEEGEEEE